MSGLRPAVFVDRDGTLISERAYLADPKGVALIPGVVPALAALKRAGFPVVVVTNQSGVARGLYSESDYQAVAGRLDEILQGAGVPVDLTLYCLHHPDITGPCECRKPGTGMHLQAAVALGLNLERSYYIGDKLTDVLPALVLGGQGILVRTGYGAELESGAPDGTVVVDDLSAAVDHILELERR